MTTIDGKQLVKRARTKLGLQELAAKLGVVRQTLWRYESGDPVPKRVQLAIIALLAEAEQSDRSLP